MQQTDYHQTSIKHINLAQVKTFENYQPIGIETILGQRQFWAIMADDSEVMLEQTDELGFVQAMDAYLGLA